MSCRFSELLGFSDEHLRFWAGWEGPGRCQLDFLQFSSKPDHGKLCFAMCCYVFAMFCYVLQAKNIIKPYVYLYLYSCSTMLYYFYHVLLCFCYVLLCFAGQKRQKTLFKIYFYSFLLFFTMFYYVLLRFAVFCYVLLCFC